MFSYCLSVYYVEIKKRMVLTVKKLIILGVLNIVFASLASADKVDIVKSFSTFIPGMTKENISATPISGLYQITVGPRVLYVSEDGRYLVQGEIVNLTTRENLTANSLKKLREVELAKLDESEMIIYPAKDPKYTVTIFSDIDCGYCRKLHGELSSYTKMGITVRYLFFPRSGVDTNSYHKAVSVWCAKDRRQALTDAKLHNKVISKTCENPVRQHMAIADAFGVSGTPAIFTENGLMIPGYLPAKELIKYLQQE